MSETKTQNVKKQALKKGVGGRISSKGSLSEFKEKHGLSMKSGESVSTVSNANKPQSWILMPEAFQEATKLPGIPENTVVSCIGHSNVGKSTLINHAIASAQKQGLIPVIIDTENAFSFKFAQNMGFEAEPIYGDVEVEVVNEQTGEVEIEVQNQIVHWDGNFIYYNNKILCDRFGDIDYMAGKKTKTKRTIAVIEDVASAINELLDAQDAGEIDRGFLFVWDSVGSIGCYKEYNSGAGVGKIGNPMWTAAAISAAFNLIVNDRIPSSKKISCPYNNTFLYINKIWMDSMSNPVGPAIMTTKGGKSLLYSCRLQIQMGGQLTSGIKRLTATYKGFTYSYGIETKIKVLKNHLDAPHNVCYEGKMIASDVGFVSVDKLETFKKEHIADILKELNEIGGGNLNIKSEDVVFTETEEDSYSE